MYNMLCVMRYLSHVTYNTCHLSLTATATAMDPPSANSPNMLLVTQY